MLNAYTAPPTPRHSHWERFGDPWCAVVWIAAALQPNLLPSVEHRDATFGALLGALPKPPIILLDYDGDDYDGDNYPRLLTQGATWWRGDADDTAQPFSPTTNYLNFSRRLPPHARLRHAVAKIPAQRNHQVGGTATRMDESVRASVMTPRVIDR